MKNHKRELVNEMERRYKSDTEEWGYDEKLNEDVAELLSLVPHSSILEVGCGKGYLTKELMKMTHEVTAIDISETALEAARRTSPDVTFERVSFEEFRLDRQYDVVVCSEVLYYMKDRREALQKMQRAGKYLITNNYLLSSWNIGFGSIIYELLLRRFHLVKWKLDFRLHPLNLEIKSLWKMK